MSEWKQHKSGDWSRKVGTWTLEVSCYTKTSGVWWAYARPGKAKALALDPDYRSPAAAKRALDRFAAKHLKG